MSTTDEENTHQRTVKLCQHVYDRQIDSVIAYEIRKLLAEGVLIDFQDQSRNKKTVIHLAVEKRDVICLNFLLRYNPKPSLEVRDGDGKTPVELAELKGDQNIINLLLNSTVDVVTESFIEVIDFQSITTQKIEAIKSRPTFKVLKVINCPSINEVWTMLNDRDYTTTLNDSSHLFFIAIETKETSIQNDHEMMKKVLTSRRPMIVQLTSSNSKDTQIFYQEESKDFVEITDTSQMTQEEFDVTVLSKDECTLKLLVAALRSNLFGHFTGNLLDTKLETNEIRNEAVNQFAKSNALCHRFCNLFDKSPPQIERIIATVSFEGDQSLLALLDLPSELKEDQIQLNEYQQDILRVVDSRGRSLLMMAAEYNNLDAVKLLIRCGCDFNHFDHGDMCASDICWEIKAFDCLAELIEAGSPYPINFLLDELDESSEAHARITEMIETINSFHENIEDEEITEVKKFITSHPHIKHAFDTNNKCALTVSLQTNQVDIHSLLLSNGFEPGAYDDEYQNACSKSRFKKEIRDSHRKYFKEAFDEPHLKRLLKMFRLSFGSKDRAKCSTIIRKMFDELNEIDELIPILKICSLSDKLRIVFDFNCNSVVDMDPTSPSNSAGVVYPIGGFVYVGAKNHEKEFFKVIGALIHELTHYAMKLTYENSCKPYDDDHIDIENRFEAITRETKNVCEVNLSTDSIVTTVFNWYQKQVWHQELIVRVPQLLAHYKINRQALKAAERNTPELFHFYREQTLKDIERQSKTLLQKYLISKINNQTGIARKLENLNVHFKNVEIILRPSVYVFTSNAPQLTLAMLNQFDCDDSYIFVTLEQVALGNILDKIAKVNAKESSTALIVDCIEQTQKYPESLRKLLKSIKNMKTIALVMSQAESSKTKENFSKVEVKTFDHKWGELTESSKVFLLHQNVIFQGVEMKLIDLVEPSSEAMNFFPLGDLLELKNFKIGNESNQQSHNFYIPRKFIQKGETNSARVPEVARNFSDILRDVSWMGAMIISDEAGCGKSVSLLEIAKCLHQMFPDRWILFADLKLLIGTFKNIEDYEKIIAFEDFIVQNVLKNETKFDQEIFKQMFRDGKTFVLFDGFDEICPNYKDLLLHVLKLFEAPSSNQLCITTRPYLEADLERVLGKSVYKLEEFSEESQTNFLREYWHSVGLKISQKDFGVLSKRLLEKFVKIAVSKLIGIPLLMRMTAEIFEDPIRENSLEKVDSLSISSVFHKFVEKYFARWTNNENEIARIENVNFLISGGILEVHHNIAIKRIFDDDFINFEVVQNDIAKISRVGLVQFDKNEKTFQFIHETFAEFFVANFIWIHLHRQNQNQSHECRLAIEVLIEILDWRYSRDFKTEVIQTFLEQILESNKFVPSEAFCKSVAKCFGEVLKSTTRFDFLRKSLPLVTSRGNLTNLLLSIVKHVEKDVLLKMLQSKASSTGSVLLNAAAFMSSAIVTTLCNLIATCTDNPKEIFKDEGPIRNVLLSAAGNKNIGVLTALCKNMNSVLTKFEIKTMFQQMKHGENIIVSAANTIDEVFLELLSLLPKYLTPDEIKNLLFVLFDRRNQDFFHRAITRDTKESLEVKFVVLKSNFTKNQQKVFFFRKTITPNMFHCAARNPNVEVFPTLVESTSDILSGDELKFLLMQKDSDGSNVLHITAEHGNAVALNELNLLLREHLPNDEIESLLLEVKNNGQNCFRLAANNDEINLPSFCEIIGNLISIEDQNRLLQQSIHEIDIIRLACDSNSREIVPVETIKNLLTRRNAFQEVAHRGDVDTWNKLTSFAQAIFSGVEMKTFLFSSDKNGKNCLHQAVSRSSHGNIVEAICVTIKTVLIIEDQKMLLKQKDSSGRNIFHLASTSSNTCFPLYDCLSKILSNDEINEMLKEKDSDGDNILCSKRKSPSVDFVPCDLIPFLQAILTKDEIKDLLFDVNCEGRNFFHCTVEIYSKSKIKSSIKSVKEILSPSDQKKFFSIKTPNVFCMATRNPNREIFSTLHECLEDVVTDNEIKSLIQEKNSENINVLHLICIHKDANDDNEKNETNDNNEKKLRDFLKVLKNVCDADELKDFLLSADNDGSNCLLLAAQHKGQLFFKELFSFIRCVLSNEDQRILVQKCDNDGKDIFTCAFFNKVPEILSFIEQCAKEIPSKIQPVLVSEIL